MAGHLADALAEPVRTDQLVLYTSGGIGHAVSSSPDRHGHLACCATPTRRCIEPRRRARAGSPRSTARCGSSPATGRSWRATCAPPSAGASCELAYQPAIELGTGRIVGAEALCGGRTTSSAPIGPAEFVPLAEETGLIVDIGAWVLHEATRTLRRWMDAGAVDDRFTMAVNVSAVQLGDGLVELATSALARARPAARAAGRRAHRDRAHRQPRLGHRRAARASSGWASRSCSTTSAPGYSSLSYLQTIALDALKIDRSFVAGLGVGSRDASIVTAIVNMGKAFGLEVIAEGVETEAQEQQLIAIGCRQAQGYHYSHPVPSTRSWNCSGRHDHRDDDDGARRR